MIRTEQQLDKQLLERRRVVRSVYDTPAGLPYLVELIKRSGLFDHIATEEDRIRHNVMVDQLDEMGLLDEEGIGGLVRWMMDQPLRYRKTIEEMEEERNERNDG